MSDDVTITVRVNDQTAAGFRDVNGRLRDLNGRFATTAGDMNRSSSTVTRALGDIKASMLSLAPAAIPVAASMAPIAVQAGAAAVAVGAFGAALAPQISHLGDAAKAQDTYNDAVQKYGRGSTQAAQAQLAASQTLAAMPAATQRAAVGWQNLREQTSAWSDSLAKFTMAPVEKSFAVMGQVLPKLTPMVKGTATELDRLMTVAGGGVNTGAFDALSQRVSDFANQTLKGATDKAIHFMRVLSEGNASGPIASFFEYARQQGPAVKDLLSNVARAVSNLMEGAAQAGPGLLTLVNAMAKLVASVPPALIANLMQVYAAFKLIKLAGAGVDAVAGAFGTLAGRVAALRAAAVAAGGGMAGLNAAMATLSTGGKAMLAAGAIGALVVAMHQLSDNKAPVAVDELSTALNTLASKGKVTGALKENFDEISESIAMVSKGASDNSIATMVSDFGTWIGLSTGPGISDAKKNVDAWDKSMANLVRGGKPKEAAAQYEILKKAWVAGGGDLGRLKTFTNDYSDALADAKFEQQMAAESMGMFGSAAQATQAKLAEQKSAADGLRQSLQALNDVQRAALGGMIGFEASIDSAAKAAKDNAGSLRMVNGELDVNSPKAQAAATALSDLAAKTDEATAKALEAHKPWERVNGIYSRGRENLVKYAEQMGLSSSEAERFAKQVLRIPTSKQLRLEMRKEDAERGLNAFNAAVKRTPGSKSVTLKTLSSAAEQVLESFGYKVTHLKNGSVKVSAVTGGALSGIRNVAGAIASLRSRTVTITTVNRFVTTGTGSKVAPAHRDYAAGGLVRGYAGGGDVQSYPGGGYVEGPGSGTSDSILTLLGSGNVVRSSNTEFIVNAKQTARHRRLLELINSGQLPRFAKGGLAKGEKQARHDAWGDLTVSHFGRMAGYGRSEFGAALGRPDSIGALVSALGQWRGIIMKATHGGTESRLLKQLDSTAKGLLKYEKQLNTVTKSLDKAKDKLNSLKDAASSLASSVKGGILGSANITRGVSGGGLVTTASIMGGLTQSRDKATALASALKGLKKKGLSSSLLRQIAEAGVEGGGLETAGALLEASGSEIKSLNETQSQINKAAGSAGKTTADAVYGKAIHEQTKTVKSLQHSQDKLRHSMDKLARAMEKSIEKAFGKKAAGGIVGAAASGGIRGGLTWVGEHEPELLQLPVGSRVWSGPDSRRKAAQAPWASMLNTPRRSGGGGAVPASAGRPEHRVVLELRSSGAPLDEFLLKILRNAINVRGGNAQVVLTGRK